MNHPQCNKPLKYTEINAEDYDSDNDTWRERKAINWNLWSEEEWMEERARGGDGVSFYAGWMGLGFGRWWMLMVDADGWVGLRIVSSNPGGIHRIGCGALLTRLIP